MTDHFRQTPAQVYRCFNADDELLYVGSSVNTMGRLVKHRYEQGWYHEVTKITVEHFDSRGAAEMAEFTAIREESPKYNIIKYMNWTPMQARYFEEVYNWRRKSARYSD